MQVSGEQTVWNVLEIVLASDTTLTWKWPYWIPDLLHAPIFSFLLDLALLVLYLRHSFGVRERIGRQKTIVHPVSSWLGNSVSQFWFHHFVLRLDRLVGYLVGSKWFGCTMRWFCNTSLIMRGIVFIELFFSFFVPFLRFCSQMVSFY